MRLLRFAAFATRPFGPPFPPPYALMTVAIAGRAPATFAIKSAMLPLVSLLLKTGDLDALAAELSTRFGDIPDFFDNDPLVLDLSPLRAQGDLPVDFAALLDLLHRYRVLPVAARGGTTAQMQAALAAGLAAAPEAVTQPPPAPARAKAAAPAPAAADGPAMTALVIDKPLRSGQQVYARGRDLVMLSMVNPGAEVIADGHIHVYAPLRGKAIAGHRGNTEARIFSTCLEPELIAIAGVYRTTETALPANVLGKPAQVRLVGDKLVMEPLQTT